MLRLLDIVLSAIAIFCLAPLLLPVIVILRITGEGEVFYRQERVGLGKKTFYLMKFATMLKDSPNIGSGTITIENDPRVLPFGKFLRKTKINELPQLFNIFFGQMSVIGPRPLTEDNFNMYPEKAREAICGVKPGLSGIGSVVFRDEESMLGAHVDPKIFYETQIAPYKAELELWFVENVGVRTYLLCIMVTIWVVLRPKSQIVRSVFKNLPAPGESLQRYFMR